MLSIWL
jgi:phoR_proteo: phosphate regulon sensor kinase PhoR